MTALYRNDVPGQHAPSVYAAGLNAPLRPSLTGKITVDVAVIGAGFTGLWAAVTLAKAGRSVAILDAHRVGFGASGRNGGQVQSGFNKGQRALEERLGQDRARALWDLAETAKDQLRTFCADNPETAFAPGAAHAFYDRFELAEARMEAEHLHRNYGVEAPVLDRATFADLVKSTAYIGGVRDPSGGHLHPLNYALALAKAAEAAGATIYEKSEVTDIAEGAHVSLRTSRGEVEAGHLIVAGNGYLPNILPPVNRKVMPINSFIAATAPLPDHWQEVLAENIAVSDDRFVVNYYRFDADKRFLFGGRESYSVGFPTDIRTALIARMEALFPQIKGTPIDYVWGGSLGITPSRLPHVARMAPNILSGAGFSGHGVALSGMAGRVMAEAILGQDDGLTTFEALDIPSFPGGTALRAPILALAMMWFALRDRIGF